MSLVLAALLLAAVPAALAQDPPERDQESSEPEKKKKKELTLERLFPEKGLFGPAARSTSFSRDGLYGAFLWRPYPERRHGSDLWIYDTETGEARRITKVSVMSEFQAATRKVRDDRIEKAKKRRAKKKEGRAQDGDGEADDDAAAPSDDGVSGEWDGLMRLEEGGDETDFPPDGLTFTLSIRVARDGSVSGTLVTPIESGTITEGEFDRESGRLTCTIISSESGLQAMLDVVIRDQSMTGSLSIQDLEMVLAIEAERTAPDDAGRDVDEDEEEDDDDGDDDGDDDDEEIDLGDLVDDKDADDEKAPRYGGVSTYTWAPEAREMIFTSGGDLYRYDADADEITRLTITREPERDVQYLPDGSGYTYLRSGALLCVRFGEHRIDQLDPKLESGESMSGYRISPDGTRVVILSGKGKSTFSAGRKVSIVNYRERFARVREYTRHMPDDPLPDYEWSVYLYDLDGHVTEEGTLEKVYTHKQTGPRDIMRVPQWAPDSSRVAFAVFAQDSEHVEILEATIELKEEEEEEEDDTGDAEDESDGESETEDDDDDEDDEDGDEDEDDDEDDGDDEEEWTVEISEAKVIYRLLHNGGPNTPRMIEPRYLPDSRRLVFLTELSGFRHLHVLDPTYEQLDQLTRGRFEVYPFDQSEDHTRIFALATKDDPAQQHVFSIDLESGELTQLSAQPGYYSSAAASDDGRHVLASYVDFGTLRELVAIDVEAADGEPRTLTDSHPEEAHELTEPVPQYFSFENRHGQTIHGHMFTPPGFDPEEDQRPLLIYVYGGPLGTRKMVTRGQFSAASYFFAYYMAKKHGYVTCTIDPRGASGYGGLFEKSNFEQVGKPQVEDLVDGARWFVEQGGVDEKRIGLHGWSFGGFQTQMCLYTEPDVFACGIAGAGPTEWENYNSWYSTGTIGPSREGKTDLEAFSLLPLAKNLKAKLLLVHGMEDSNVLYQDTVRVYRELLKAGKETLVELFLDPTGSHGLGGDVKTLGRYRKYEEFLVRCLGEGPVPEEEEEEEDEEEEESTTEDTEEEDEGEGDGSGG
jgi:dipeptidyl aminopeptidase/acylaminoacyl peptidase